MLRSLSLRLAALATAALTLSACEDSLSTLGESIQPQRDKVSAETTYLQFEASSTASTQSYNNTGTALLGALEDPTYGSLAGDFITQFRSAQGFSFSPAPVGSRIDSTILRIYYHSLEGLASAPLQLEVYEAQRGFAGLSASSSNLKQYTTGSALFSKSIVPSRDARVVRTQTDSLFILSIPLGSALGQRIYDASVATPAVFASQSSFSQQVLGGLYITTTNGRGAIMQVLQTSLDIYYKETVKASTGLDSVAVRYKEMVSTSLTPRALGLSSAGNSALLSASSDYFYLKGPSAVGAQLTLPVSQLQLLLDRIPKPSAGETVAQVLGHQWLPVDLQLSLELDPPSEALLSAPSRLALLPPDSVAALYQTGLPTSSTFVSQPYSQTTKRYAFRNISSVILKHLQEHASISAGQWVITEPLVLSLQPIIYNEQQGVLLGVQAYILPYFARFRKGTDYLRLPVVTAQFSK